MAKTGDRDLWHAALRDVKPLRKQKPAAAAKASPPRHAAGPPASAAPAIKPDAHKPERLNPLPPITGPRAPGLDKASAERLKRGHYPIEARIDLHGMTQDDAHRTLGHFIQRSAERGLRCVLVITGKGLRRVAGDEAGGRPGEIGILRNAVPRWLNEAPNRARILAFGTAQQRDGGGGALYVLLRRQPRGRAGEARE
jgi:DNA-nicking Smr family endonuclease